jgi:hypothetical protein
LKTQIEENQKFREMLSNFIDHKNRKALIEDIHSNQTKQSIQDFDIKVQEILSNNAFIDNQK